MVYVPWAAREGRLDRLISVLDLASRSAQPLLNGNPLTESSDEAATGDVIVGPLMYVLLDS